VAEPREGDIVVVVEIVSLAVIIVKLHAAGKQQYIVLVMLWAAEALELVVSAASLSFNRICVSAAVQTAKTSRKIARRKPRKAIKKFHRSLLLR
jgi:hypothetical protein